MIPKNVENNFHSTNQTYIRKTTFRSEFGCFILRLYITILITAYTIIGKKIIFTRLF